MNEELEKSSTAKNKLFILTVLLILIGGGFIWFGLRQTPSSITSEPQQVSITPPTSSSETLGVLGEETEVIKVIDGDTIEIVGGQKVRLIGIDTPETVDPRRGVGCFGKEASAETKKLVEGKQVILEKDVSETDRFGRKLRYVYLKQESGEKLMVNDYLVRQGFAKAATFPPDVKYSSQLMEAERESRESKRGLWGRCE